MKFERIFTPININGMELKNRLVMPPIHLHYNEGGYATKQFNEFYYRRAEGGVGLIIVGGCRFDDYGAASGMMSLQYDKFIPGYKEFTDGIHARGAKVAVQLYHAGRYTFQRALPEGKQALAPSATVSGFTKEMAKEMTKDEMKEIIKNWADAAVRAKNAGFDAVEILGSAGYLICQFLSPVTNLRTDEYGGSWENRTRFPLEVIAAVREAVGADYPITMRISGNDFIEGSNTNTEAVEFAKLIEKAGIDMINVTGGWHETLIPQLPGEVPRAQYTYLAQAIKDSVCVPVIACNRINDPIIAETVLAMGKADLIGIGRPLIADPDWPKKAQQARQDEIRRCVACNQGCLANTFFAKPVECLVNGISGREYLMKSTPADKKKNILVVGAGAAGLEFAIEAAKRGHKITIWEKEYKIGGQVNLVKIPEGREEFQTLLDYYNTMLNKLEIPVVYGKNATPEQILSGGFDEVVIATGATPKVISLPNSDESIPVVTADSVLAGDYIPGKNVVVIGGGAVGCETAQLLARQGALSAEQTMFLMTNQAESLNKIKSLVNNSIRKVNVIELQKRIGNGFAPGCGWPILNDMKRLGVVSHTLAKVKSVLGGKVLIEKETKEGIKDIEIPCDTIVLAVGYKSENNLYEDIKDKISNAHILGDAKNVSKILDAIHQADDLAYNI